MNLRLVKASGEYRSQISDMMEEWNSFDEKIVPYAIRRLDYRDFENYCNNLEIRDDGSGLVPDSTFFFWEFLRPFFLLVFKSSEEGRLSELFSAASKSAFSSRSIISRGGMRVFLFSAVLFIRQTFLSMICSSQSAKI